MQIKGYNQLIIHLLDILSIVTPSPTVVDSAKKVFNGADNVSFTPVAPEVIWFSAFGTVGSIIAASLSLVSSLLNAHKIQEVHLSLNSRLSELLESNKVASHAAGVQEEKDRVAATFRVNNE